LAKEELSIDPLVGRRYCGEKIKKPSGIIFRRVLYYVVIKKTEAWRLALGVMP
jgi:hypothetical protein